MDTKTKGRVTNALRRLSFSYPPISAAKKAKKVGPATFECNICGIYVYDGSKDLSKLENEILSAPKGFIKDKVSIDHIIPVVCPIKGWQGWDSFVERLFCDMENLQCICKPCHAEKKKSEDIIRKEQKRLDKLNKD